MSNDGQSAIFAAKPATESSADLPLQEVISRANKLLGAGGRAIPKRFNFEWQNITFRVVLAQPDAELSAVIIEACLGRLPYTAQDAPARNTALKLVSASPRDVPGRLRIDRTGMVHLVMETEPVKVEGLAGLLKEVSYHVLGIADQLRRLRDLLVD